MQELTVETRDLHICVGLRRISPIGAQAALRHFGTEQSIEQLAWSIKSLEPSEIDPNDSGTLALHALCVGLRMLRPDAAEVRQWFAGWSTEPPVFKVYPVHVRST